MAAVAAVPLAWASGMFDGEPGPGQWFTIGALLAFAWIIGGLLVSLFFFGAGSERRQKRPKASPHRGGMPVWKRHL